MDFEKRLEKAIQRGRKTGDAKTRAEAEKATSEEDLKRMHTALRLELSHDTDVKVVSLNVGPIRTKIRENSRAHFERWISPLVERSAFRSFYEKKFAPRLYGPYKKDVGELEPAAETAKVRCVQTFRTRPSSSVGFNI